MARRHGTILRSGQGMLLDETTLCATCWMHGVFASLLTIGNTSFHRLFSAARDPYNIVRSGGLRILIDAGAGWELLGGALGLRDGPERLRLDLPPRRADRHGHGPSRRATIRRWRGASPSRARPAGSSSSAGSFSASASSSHAGRVEIDTARLRFAFRPDPASLWGQRYPDAVYHLVTDTPDAIEAIGGDELLYADGRPRGGGHVAMLTRATAELRLRRRRLDDRPRGGGAPRGAVRAGRRRRRRCSRRPGDTGSGSPAACGSPATGPGVAALDTLFPWLAHNAMIHLTVPHGLEQFSGAAWGTRDVCQGPVEFLLALEHDATVREILRTVFEQQNETRGDWPQWFMLEPYASIRDRHSHGDVIVWPLKAVCDYVEATNDLGFLDEPVAWRREDNLEKTARRDPVAAHLEKLLATVRERFIPGTHLIRYGEGDWNNSLQPADPHLRDWMVSSWTVALLYQQLNRYAEVLTRAGRRRRGRPS